MQKFVVAVLIGLLGYICLMLTSINNKIDAIYASGTQYAVLNEVKPQSFTGDAVQNVAFKDQSPVQLAPQTLPVNAGLMVVAMIAIFVSWHVSRAYHAHQWTKTILKKTYTHYRQPYQPPEPAAALHLDQDCVGDAPQPDGRIKESWLPAHAKEVYSAWHRR